MDCINIPLSPINSSVERLFRMIINKVIKPEVRDVLLFLIIILITLPAL